ncbi:MAG: outer membrane beta-barrel protein [Candidatus Sericytochromatia bacterium]|nr:outer membrane beta-barrel protein [Candidatus Sericytochromatia bacterium]
MLREWRVFQWQEALGSGARVALIGLLLQATWLASPALAAEEPDFHWLNGTNPQRVAPLQTGPLTWTLLVDTYYGQALNQPADHTVFPTTTAPRHHEINLNLGLLGVEVTEQEGLYGKLVLQGGNYVDAIFGADPSVGRGAYNSLAGMRTIQQAWAGHRFPVLSGLNVVMGLFPAYIGLDSYLPQENWNYTHNLCSDFTPYYLQGLMAQLYPRPELKAELWLVNGWQTLGKTGEGFGLGYSLNWRLGDRLSLTHNVLGGQLGADPTRLRIFTDNACQWRYAVAPWPGVKHLALAAVADLGHEGASGQVGGQPATLFGGGGLLHRVVFNDQWAATLRASSFYDPQRLVALAPPGATSGGAPLWAGEGTATLDYSPSPWMLYRLEARHDLANTPYVAGPGGITATPPDFRLSGSRLVLNATLRF